MTTAATVTHIEQAMSDALYVSPSGRYRVDADRITDTWTGRSAPIQHASVAIVTAELLESYDLPATPEVVRDPFAIYESVREDQRREDDLARRAG